MTAPSDAAGRVVSAVHGLAQAKEDAAYEIGLTEHLKQQYDRRGLEELLVRFTNGEGALEMTMRRVLWRALAKRLGHGVRIGSGVGYKHIETFELGSNVFIGAQAYIQGRFDGTTVIGDHTWIGPQSYFDARNLVIEDHVGWGPGAKVLGSEHTGEPIDRPIIETDLVIKPVRIGAWTDIGTNAVILPGVTVGKGAIVGAGAIVTRDVEPFTIVAGVPAKLIRKRGDKPASGGV